MANANPLLKRLGFGERDRVVILHADDIGMFQANVEAYAELLAFGLLSSAATMVPCPWFPAVAALCRREKENPRLDMGVHLTLNSEWSSFRWGPVTTRDAATGLVDEAGLFFDDPDVTQEKASVSAVRTELQGQIERAIAAGIEPTHIDSHMGALFHPRFLPTLFELSSLYRLPALMLRFDAARIEAEGYDTGMAERMARLAHQAEESGLPLLDEIREMPLDHGDNRLERAQQVLSELPPGISYMIVHPAKDTPELRAAAPDWPARVADYQLFTSEAWRQAVHQSGVQVIGYRAVRDVMG